METTGPKYKKFDELAAGEQRGTDYEIHSTHKGSNKYGVFGIHGGKISEVITHLTDRIAGNDHSKYLFEARKERGNSDLILKGHSFNEPEAVNLAQRSAVVVSLAISQNKDRTILVDGRNEHLADELTKSLKENGFSVKKPFASHLNGHKKTNIANQGNHEMGVQIQIPKALRTDMTEELRGENPDQEGTLISKFSNSVKSVLDRVSPDRSVAETHEQGTRDGRARTSQLYIGEFSELKLQKKLEIAQSIIETNGLYGVTPEGLEKKLQNNTVFVAYDKQNGKLQAAAGLKKMKETIKDKMLKVYEDNDPYDRYAKLLVDKHDPDLQKLITHVEHGTAAEYGWATNKSRDKDKFRAVLNLLFKDAEKKGFGPGSIFSVVRADNTSGLNHARNMGMKPVMEMSSPFTQSASKLVIHVYKGRPAPRS